MLLLHEQDEKSVKKWTTLESTTARMGVHVAVCQHAVAHDAPCDNFSGRTFTNCFQRQRLRIVLHQAGDMQLTSKDVLHGTQVRLWCFRMNTAVSGSTDNALLLLEW